MTSPGSIPDRFEKVVRTHPDRLAIKHNNRSVTYDGLNKAANRIAGGILKALGSGNEPVATLLPNGVGSVACFLGLLKAGKCVVAIDPSFPLQRIDYIFKDTAARLIVTDDVNFNVAKGLAGDSRILCNIGELGDDCAEHNLGFAISGDSTGMISYTSGSTGDPKGVVLSHELILEAIDVHIDVLSVRDDDRLSLIHSISFTGAYVNLFRGLLAGASVFPFDVKECGVVALVRWLIDQEISIFHCPPSLFRQFIDCLPANLSFPRLRAIQLSGAPIVQADFARYKTHFPPSTSLIFHMGSTEAACIAYARMNHDFRFPQEGTPVGYVQGAKKVLLLDEDRKTVEPGSIGEIAVQSRYLAKEYWRNPELTKLKFFPVPESPDERIYLTGDLGRFEPDGLLVHLGRKDLMMKIRGYRVELGEVEHALLAHRDIQQAAVVTSPGENAEPYLAAYVVPRRGRALAVDEIVGFLRNQLPDYMIPLRFAFLPSLPLSNGKLDRKALPPLQGTRPEMNCLYQAPQSEIELTLSSIWSEALGIDKVGVHDNFLTLGGHSLAASRVAARVIAHFRLELPLRALFDSPTVAHMATVISTYQDKRMDEDGLSRLLEELEDMSDEEARRLLAERRNYRLT